MSLIVSTTSALGLTESGANSTFQVGQVKEKIAQEKGWDVAQQKLIYSGKCLICWRLLLLARDIWARSFPHFSD